MAISLRTAKMLWGRGAGRCSMPECRQPLVIDCTETDNEALIGDMCHMVAESEDGPRGQSPLRREERDQYDNLILCAAITMARSTGSLALSPSKG
jgi:hypothetical protein